MVDRAMHPISAHAQATILFGPAGTGKTWRCRQEITTALRNDPQGPPLLLLVPRQATYQWERAILDDPGIQGYTRLHVFSFERLADWLLERLVARSAGLLSEQGRVMVLRALLARHAQRLEVLGASARLPSFAAELSACLREFQHARVSPGQLGRMAQQLHGPLQAKLRDFSLLLETYSAWLTDRKLRDMEARLDLATESLQHSANTTSSLRLGGIWVDGFAELTPQEIELLAALLPLSPHSTLAFCLEKTPTEIPSWLSTWSAMTRSCRAFMNRIREVEALELRLETLDRSDSTSRFARSPALAAFERGWSDPNPPPYPWSDAEPAPVRLLQCSNPEAEADEAARAILQHVRDHHGRYRDTAILVRDLEVYHVPLRRILRRYNIPFFMDRRESIAHHPLVELVRASLRFAILGGRQADLFSALKTGLFPVERPDIDWIESEALARGWDGDFWHRPVQIKKELELATRAESIRARFIRPLLNLSSECGGSILDGTALAARLRTLWNDLDLESRIQDESNAEQELAPAPGSSRWETVWRELQAWLVDLQLGFDEVPLEPLEWLPIVESGLAGLTAGQIPPALDQVLVGSVDRARNPDLKLVVVLGLNEGIFPRAPRPATLIGEHDRRTLESMAAPLGGGVKHQIGVEWFYGYIAFTRSREKLLLTFSENSSAGEPVNPSPFIRHAQRVLPWLQSQAASLNPPWWEACRTEDCIPALAQASPMFQAAWKSLGPSVRLPQPYEPHEGPEPLPKSITALLHGQPLRTSVSRIERFAACPFQFFVASGLRAEERRHFDIDFKEAGSLQHDLLEAWHKLAIERRGSWRNVPPAEGKQWMEELATAIVPESGGGRFNAGPLARARARSLTETLKSWIEAFLKWMPHYAFEPLWAETAFGRSGDAFEPWVITLNHGKSMEFRGKIDRIDVAIDGGKGPQQAIVIDYKMSERKIDKELFRAGVQLQLAAYLAVIKRLRPKDPSNPAPALIPMGGFYANLRGHWTPLKSRPGESNSVEEVWSAYRHLGRFDKRIAPALSQSRSNATRGLFNFSTNKDGKTSVRTRDPLEPTEFEALLSHVESKLREFGNRIYDGEIRLDPYRKGSVTACDQCAYRSVCRIDPARHVFRTLGQPSKEEPE